MKTTPELRTVDLILKLHNALKRIVIEGTKTPTNLHDVQVQRYSKWAVEIAKAALGE